jgi:hypothetical protein
MSEGVGWVMIIRSALVRTVIRNITIYVCSVIANWDIITQHRLIAKEK